MKRSGDFLSMQARKRFASGIVSPVATTSHTEESDSAKPIDRLHADAIMNYLTRIACQVPVGTLFDYIRNPWLLDGLNNNIFVRRLMN